MGHALEGVSAKYIAEMIVLRSDELREAQCKISARVFELLGLKLYRRAVGSLPRAAFTHVRKASRPQ